MIHIRSIHLANFGEKSLSPLQLLKKINKFKLDDTFYNVCTALGIFCIMKDFALKKYKKHFLEI